MGIAKEPKGYPQYIQLQIKHLKNWIFTPNKNMGIVKEQKGYTYLPIANSSPIPISLFLVITHLFFPHFVGVLEFPAIGIWADGVHRWDSLVVCILFVWNKVCGSVEAAGSVVKELDIGLQHLVEQTWWPNIRIVGFFLKKLSL